MAQRLLVVSPVRNEAAHLELVANAVERQTRSPDLWILVDDGSTDRTPEVLARLDERIGFVNVIYVAEQPSGRPAKDRLAMAAAPRTFNLGLRSAPWRSFTHIAKLDGDTELPPDYFERLLGEFARDPQLGLAGGVRVERTAGREQVERVPTRHHVPGALKCYTLECLVAIGGMQERLGWDTIDEVYARMRGFRTRAFPELIAVHHRPWGSADGRLRGSARHGRCAYILHYPLPWAVLRSVTTAGSRRPWGLSGLAYLSGYLGAAARTAPRVDDPEFRTFIRGELRGRVRDALTGLRSDTGRLHTLARLGG